MSLSLLIINSDYFDEKTALQNEEYNPSTKNGFFRNFKVQK